jgi:hypothetical protein
MRISGTFVYQPQTIIYNTLHKVGEEDFFPCAIAVGLVILNDDGSPVFPDGVNPAVDCSVALSMPFVPGAQGGIYGIHLAQVGTVEVLNDGHGYVRLTYELSRNIVDSLPAGWTPMAILASVNLENDALLLAAPAPAADMGILPPVRPGISSGGGTRE